MQSDSKKRRSFLALLFAAGDLQRWAIQYLQKVTNVRSSKNV
jgi:hypothetical protein